MQKFLCFRNSSPKSLSARTAKTIEEALIKDSIPIMAITDAPDIATIGACKDENTLTKTTSQLKTGAVCDVILVARWRINNLVFSGKTVRNGKHFREEWLIFTKKIGETEYTMWIFSCVDLVRVAEI